MIYNKFSGYKALILLFVLAFFADFAFGSDEHSQKENPEQFDVGASILEHVTDNYEWHLWGTTSIPLPVILYSSTKGLDVFLFSKLKEGQSYHGYKAEEGKIVSEDNTSFFDFSMTKTVVEILLACALMLLIFISVAKSYARRKDEAPKGLQSLIEPILIFVRDDIAKASIGEKHYKRFLPLLLTIFFFIWVNNMLGLIPIFPGGANVMGNISVTLALAALVLVITLFIGNKHYWKHILWMPGVPALVKILLLTPIEILGVFQRPAVLMIRLFANVLAGHIIILSFVFLIFIFGMKGEAGGWGFAPVSMAFAIFMNAMELLVAFLQAFVFTLLTAMYIGACLEDPHTDDHVAV